MALTPLRKAKVPDVETCWALLERVAASSHLRRAARLQELLFYMGKRSLKDRCDRLQEQEIGVQVFGRPDSYDTTFDNIVRTNVSDLRKRLEAYFNSEGAHEKLIVEIPRGNYLPVFRYRSAEPELPPRAVSLPIEIPEVPAVQLLDVAPVPPPPPAAPRPQWLNPWFFASLGVILLLVGVAFFYWNRYRSLYAWQSRPAVATLWSQILDTGSNTDIVLSDDSFALAQTLSHRTFSLKDYLSRSYLDQLQTAGLSPDMNTALSRIVGWNLGSPDEFMLARRILALDPLGKNVHLFSARYYIPDLIKRDNVILIGARKSNPWDELFESKTNFVTRFNDDGSVAVVNRAPAPGESAVYTETDTSEYCTVAYLPNPDHNGIALLIEGTDAEATEAAGDFLLSEEQLSSFRNTLRSHDFPFFEVLLKVSSVRGTPLTATVAAYRLHPDQH